MTIGTLLRTVVIGSALLCGSASFAQIRLPPDEDEPTVQQLIANLQTALNTGNVERFAAEFTPKARLVMPSGEILANRDAIRANFANAYTGFFKGAITAIRIDRVVPLGIDYAMVDTTHFVRNLRSAPVWAIETKPGAYQLRARYISQRIGSTDWQVLGLQTTPIRPIQQARK